MAPIPSVIGIHIALPLTSPARLPRSWRYLATTSSLRWGLLHHFRLGALHRALLQPQQFHHALRTPLVSAPVTVSGPGHHAPRLPPRITWMRRMAYSLVGHPSLLSYQGA